MIMYHAFLFYVIFHVFLMSAQLVLFMMTCFDHVGWRCCVCLFWLTNINVLLDLLFLMPVFDNLASARCVEVVKTLQIELQGTFLCRKGILWYVLMQVNWYDNSTCSELCYIWYIIYVCCRSMLWYLTYCVHLPCSL